MRLVPGRDLRGLWKYQIGKQSGISLDDFTWYCKRCKTKLRLPKTKSCANISCQTGLLSSNVDQMITSINLMKAKIDELQAQVDAAGSSSSNPVVPNLHDQPPPPPPEPPSCRACLRYPEIETTFLCPRHFQLACSLIREEEDEQRENIACLL